VVLVFAGCRVLSYYKDALVGSEPLAPRSYSRSIQVAAAAMVSSCPHAKSAPPQELHFMAPLDCVPGRAVCLQGPHGDPLTVALPEGAEPGKPCHICLGVTWKFQIVVPEGAVPGASVSFSTTDWGMLNAAVPPGKMPGESFEISPPLVIVQVPPSAKPGDEVTYTTPAGSAASVRVPVGHAPGHYFPVLLPKSESPNETITCTLQEQIGRIEGANSSQLCTSTTLESLCEERSDQQFSNEPVLHELFQDMSYCNRPELLHELFQDTVPMALQQHEQDSCSNGLADIDSLSDHWLVELDVPLAETLHSPPDAQSGRSPESRRRYQL